MGAGDSIAVSKELIGMGLPGMVILVLMSVVTILAGVIVIQWKQANKVYSYRLAERDTLNKALTENTAALVEKARLDAERNDILEALGDVIKTQSSHFEMLIERLRSQHEQLREDNKREHDVIASMADSVRSLTQSVVDVKNAFPNFVTEVRNAVTAAVISRGRV